MASTKITHFVLPLLLFLSRGFSASALAERALEEKQAATAMATNFAKAAFEQALASTEHGVNKTVDHSFLWENPKVRQTMDVFGEMISSHRNILLEQSQQNQRNQNLRQNNDRNLQLDLNQLGQLGQIGGNVFGQFFSVCTWYDLFMQNVPNGTDSCNCTGTFTEGMEAGCVYKDYCGIDPSTGGPYCIDQFDVRIYLSSFDIIFSVCATISERGWKQLCGKAKMDLLNFRPSQCLNVTYGGEQCNCSVCEPTSGVIGLDISCAAYNPEVRTLDCQPINTNFSFGMTEEKQAQMEAANSIETPTPTAAPANSIPTTLPTPGTVAPTPTTGTETEEGASEVSTEKKCTQILFFGCF